MTASLVASLRAALARFAREKNGVSAVEFALLAPVFCLIFAGTIDFGGSLYTRFNLNASVAAASNYALLNGASATSTGGRALADATAALIASTQTENWADAVVVVNNGPATTIRAGAVSKTGTAANADSCYCPTIAPAGVVWGSAMTCGGACAGGGVAGKFVSISGSRAVTPLLPAISRVEAGTAVERAIVQVQ
jgi:Flp pilus assembly protein TadG